MKLQRIDETKRFRNREDNRKRTFLFLFLHALYTRYNLVVSILSNSYRSSFFVQLGANDESISANNSLRVAQTPRFSIMEKMSRRRRKWLIRWSTRLRRGSLKGLNVESRPRHRSLAVFTAAGWVTSAPSPGNSRRFRRCWSPFFFFLSLYSLFHLVSPLQVSYKMKRKTDDRVYRSILRNMHRSCGETKKLQRVPKKKVIDRLREIITIALYI